jgi:hypothetical protein
LFLANNSLAAAIHLKICVPLRIMSFREPSMGGLKTQEHGAPVSSHRPFSGDPQQLFPGLESRRSLVLGLLG